MLKCRKCGFVYDNSDLINGVCDDCREEIRKAESNKEKFERILISEAIQMRIEDFI